MTWDRSTTADEVVAGIDLTGRTALVTGAASGIGVETARALARTGADVVLAVRNTAAGEATADDIAASTGRRPRVASLDLADRGSVAAFTAGWEGPLHLLVANAGIMALPERTLTADGWELQLATNHLGHLDLAVGLHPALAAAQGARLVMVSSTGHHRSPVVLDDLHFARRPYEPWSAYGQSKTANVLMAVEATRRWADDGIVANALMPGGIMTGLQKHVTQDVLDRWADLRASGKVVFKTTQQGAATTLVACVDPRWGEVGGHYLEDCQEAPVVEDDASAGSGVKRWALDPAAAEQLWDVSLDLLGRR